VDFKHLAYFVAVVEHGSFTAAATASGVAQSSVSWAIGRLEADVGAPLLERTTRAVTLTPEGVALLPHARQVLGQLAAGADAARTPTSPAGCTLTISAAPALPFDLVRAIEAFRGGQPDTLVRVEQSETTGDQLAAVQDGRCDVAIIAALDPVVEAVELVELACEPLVLTVSREHPLAGAGTIPIARLAEQRFATTMTNGHGAGLVTRALEPLGLSPRIAVETDQLALLLDLVEQGELVAAAGMSAVRARPRLAALEVVERLPSLRIALALPADREPTGVGGEFARSVVTVARGGARAL
jgi:DNA-binding transcriptional LysR family regulator